LLLPLLCLCSSGSSRHLLVFFVYRFSSALCCIGLNRRLIVVSLSFPNLRRLRKHRASSTSIGLTACPLFIGLTLCPLHFLSRLRVLYLPWAVFTPLPSCVGCVSTASPPADYTTTTPRSLEHLRSLEQRAATLEQRIYRPSFRIDYSTFYHLCVDYSFVSTTSPRVDYSLYQHLLEIQCAIEHIYNEYGLWTADTWAMSADAQLCDSGQRTPRDQRWQLGHASTKSGLLMARIGSSIVSRTLRTFDPAT